LLAHASYALDDDGEAERAARSCELLAAADDVVSQILWRTARAKVRARAGAFEEAEALAREAVAIAERIDFLSTQGDALLDLAEVLRLAGRKAEALIAVDEAAERYERKGNLASLERARRLAKTLAA
jgi:tetratricopeptide (TPR) repeat protein